MANTNSIWIERPVTAESVCSERLKGTIKEQIDWQSPGGLVKLCQNETLEMLPQPEKHFCSYCQSTSHDDMRGNCCCCGAPRGNDKYVRLWKNENAMNAEWFNQLSGWRI